MRLPENPGDLRPVLDVTRILRRGPKPPTGIDRVDRAYAAWVTDQNGWFCAWSGRHWVLRRACAFEDLFPKSVASGFQRWRNRAARNLRAALPGFQEQTWPDAFHFFSTSHTRLPDGAYKQVRAKGAALIAIMVHDLIPLEAPQYCRPQSVRKFQAFLGSALAHADVLICNSTATETALMMRFAPSQTVVAAPLGVTPIPTKLQARSGFLYVSTLEPRKNHLFLLRVWEVLERELPPGQLPDLTFIGKMGWLSRADQMQIMRHPLMGRKIHWLRAVSEGELADAMSRAAACIFPSHAEGFGLPVAEALAVGLPVLASDIPALREVSRGRATLLPPNDPRAWVNAVRDVPSNPKRNAPETYLWSEHFNLVRKAVTNCTS